MIIRATAKTDIGRARERNEDAFLVRDPLFAVADGMGGHRGGDVASSYALDIISDSGTGDGEETAPLPRLVRRIREANRRVMERGDADRDLRGMGTTITAVVADGERAHIAHVGDSRAYLLRDSALQQLTEDHTLVQRMVREGRLTQEQAGRHPQRSILTRAVGVEDDLVVDELTLDLHDGDRILLCSDGLTNMVGEEQIRAILTEASEPDEACAGLIDAANGAGGDDNITVVLLDVLKGSSSAAAGSRADATTVHRADGPDGGPAAPDATEADGATATRVAEPLRSPVASPPRGFRWRRAAVWTAVAIVVIVLAWIGARAYIGRQWYVGESSGRVAVFNGIPSSVLGIRLSHVEEETAIPADQAEQLRTWQGLADGITATSRQDAQGIVQQIQADLRSEQGQVGSTPGPTTSPSPSGGAG